MNGLVALMISLLFLMGAVVVIVLISATPDISAAISSIKIPWSLLLAGFLGGVLGSLAVMR